MRLLEQSNLTIFGSFEKSKEYAKLVAIHTPGVIWCVYKKPKREDFTLARLNDCWSERSFSAQSILFSVVYQDGELVDAKAA